MTAAPFASPSAIRPLSHDTRTLLRSSHLLCSLSLSIAELIDNSLDSSATSIHLSLSPSTLSFACTDNGDGLSPSSLALVGRRHFTSKSTSRHNSHWLGMRGEALASLAALATVDIHSIPRQFSPSSPLLPHHKRLSPGWTSPVTPSPPSVSTLLGRHGTSVSVHHLYSTLPVRRRALLQRGEREVERVRRRVERVALIHPSVAFTLVDEDTGRVLMTKGRVKDIPTAFADLFRPDLAASLLSFSHHPTPPSPLGCVDLHLASLTSGYHTRDYQWLYINHRPVHHLPLLRLISTVWMRCVRLYSGGVVSTHGSATSLTSTTGRPLYPVWICDLLLDEESYDCLSEADKMLVWLEDEPSILQQVREALRRGLLHHYPALQAHDEELFNASSEDRRQRQMESPSSVVESALFPSPNSLLSPSPSPIIDLTEGGMVASSEAVATERPLSLAPSRMIDLIEEVTVDEALSPPSPLPPSPLLPLFRVDRPSPRPVVALAPSARRGVSRLSDSIDRSVKRIIDLSVDSRPLPIERREKRPRLNSREPLSTSIQPLLLTPVSAAIDLTAEVDQVEDVQHSPVPPPIIPALPPPPPSPPRLLSGVSTLYHRFTSSAHADASHRIFDSPDSARLPTSRVLDSSPSDPSPPLSLLRSLLPQLRVVGQVECQFLVCVDPNGLLLAVDQHAADERIRLEDLETHIDRLVYSTALPHPLPLHLTPSEGHTLRLHQQQIERWGWTVQDSSTAPLLVGVPAVLTSSLDHADLHLYLAQLSASYHPPSHRQLPLPLLHLMHSRACKTAIRFGDALNEGQRKGLVAALAQCELPFQCAHGRPSMAPLVGMERARWEEGGRAEWMKEVKTRLKGLRVIREGQRSGDEATPETESGER